MLSKGDVRALVEETLSADRAIRAGNRDRYILGRRSALLFTMERLLRFNKEDLNRYMEWVHEQVVTQGRRLGDLEEPMVWIRNHPA